MRSHVTGIVCSITFHTIFFILCTTSSSYFSFEVFCLKTDVKFQQLDITFKKDWFNVLSVLEYVV